MTTASELPVTGSSTGLLAIIAAAMIAVGGLLKRFASAGATARN